MNASRRVCQILAALFVVILGAQRAAAQCVSLTTLASPSTQNFAALATAGTNVAWTDNSTIPGWYSTRTTYNAATGSGNAGSLYSFGVAGTNPLTDRALGGIGSGGTGTFYWAACFTNNTGSALSSVDIAYIGEQWRDGGAATPVAQTMAVEYQVAATGTITDADTPTTGWTAVPTLDFASPTFTNTGAGVLLDGNAAGNRTAKAATVTVGVAVGNEFWIRWRDLNDGGNDHALAVDDFSITPQAIGGNAAIVPTCASPITTTAGNATSGPVSATDADGTVTSASITGITPSNPGTITLTGFTPAGAVGGTANATLSVSAATPQGSYTVTIQWANNDGVPQTANCNVSVVVNAPPTITFIHDVQGNGAATPIPGATVTVEGVVIGDFQPIPNDNRLSGFFLQEENADADLNSATSEGIFVFCSACPTNVGEGQRVQVTGTVSEFFTNTQITATTAGSVVITNAGNNLGSITPATIDLPVVGVINDFYEPRENMRVSFTDTLSVSEYFEQARYGQIELFEGGRPRQFTEANAPNVAGYAAHLDNLNRRRVILDDDDNVENSVLNLPNGQQFVFHPQANGGLSVGTQGTDFFRGGDTVNGLTGILHFSFAGGPSPDEWRIRPTAATPAAFTVVNPRPATPPAVGGSIRVVAANVLNYFTTLNVRGADSTAELNRQRERTSIVLCTLDPDVAALMEIENGNAAITDLLADVNTRCGGANPYAFVNTGGSLGTDQIRVILIYRTGIVSPVGAPISDMDSVHNRPPTAQTFDVVDATNPAFGERFTAIANHSKSKGCGGASGADLDQNDGQSCFAATRVAQHNRILSWVNGTVIPAAGDPDVVLLGDFNSNAQETPTTTLTSGGYTDLETAFLGANAYSYLFDGQIGHLDYAFANASLLPQVTGVNVWHINADENPLFDYNDEIDDGAAEQAFEEKPDGSALAPPRVVFQPATAVRASDHDPIIMGIFAISDLAVTKTDSPDPVTAGNNITYTITVSNNGPDVASGASWTDTLVGTTFVSMPAVAGWSCTTPAVGASGLITCTNANFAVGSAVFTLTVNVAPSVAAGTVISNSATATSGSGDPNAGNDTGTATTTVATSAELSTTKVDTPDPVNAGSNITYTITVANAGPSNAATVQLLDTLPAGTTFVSLSSPGGWSCTTPSIGGTGNVTCTIASLGAGNAVFTLVVNVDPSVAGGTVITNSATVSSTTSDPNSGNETGTATTTVATSADLSVTKVDTPDPVSAGSNITYTITVNNAGPTAATAASLGDTLPAGTTFISLSSPLGWSCTTPAVGGTGAITCTNPSVGLGNAVFTLVVAVDPSVAGGTVISNTATIESTTTDSVPGNNSSTAATTVAASADLSVTKVDTPDPVTAGTNLTYTITVNNAGPSIATDVSLSDTVPANTTFVSLSSPAGWSCTTPASGGTGNITCTNPSVPIGSSVLTLVVNVNAATANGTVITNTATVSSTTADPNTGNESGVATTTVGTGSVDLSVTKSDSPDPVSAGANITYTINVTNAGPSNATTATLADTIPTGTTFVSFTAPGGWGCTTPAAGGTGTVSCTNASMAIGTDSFTLVVAVNPLATPGTVITNTATVSSATTDPNPGNESATTTTNVISPATLSGTKTASGSFAAGGVVTYTIVISNSGPAAQANNPGDEFVDVLPSDLTLISATANSGTATANVPTNTVTWNGSIPAGGSVTITINALIEAVPVGTTITNQGTINYDADGNGTNEASTQTDDPSQAGGGQPTGFVVGSAPANVAGVPALDGFGLAILAGLLAALGLFIVRRA